ncbi:MAG TPA: response regulator, partial [Longimicrobiales bacterium]
MIAPRARILLVDDRPENLLALEAILEPLGQEIVRASSGVEALRAVLREDFAVILLDVQMPGMNGFETATLLKARTRTRDIPLIFLTAISKEERFVAEGYSVGAVDYMSKPLQPDILRSKVSVFVDLWVKNHQLRQQAELLRESERRELELRHAAQLRETEARAAQIVGSATDTIITFDGRRQITLFNRAAEATFGIAADHAVGLPLETLLHPRARADLIARVATLGAASGVSACAAEVTDGLRADGSEFPFEASLSRLDLAGGPVFALIGRDVTERIEAEESLRRQAAELEEAATELRALNDELQTRQTELERAMSARSRFYASMSHELRTPINAILGYSELLLDKVYGELNDLQANGIERTRRAGRHLLELVNDVLDLSKIEAGKLELQFETVPFPTMLEDLFVTVKPMADQRSCELTLHQHGPERTLVT